MEKNVIEVPVLSVLQNLTEPSLEMHWISVRFYEMGDTLIYP